MAPRGPERRRGGGVLDREVTPDIVEEEVAAEVAVAVVMAAAEVEEVEVETEEAAQRLP